MVILFIAVFALCAATFTVGTKELRINRTFYFLVLPAEDGTVSVLAQGAYVGGGAGYTLSLQGIQYVALASYNTENEAKNVRNALERKGHATEILPLKADVLYFKTKSQRAVKEQVSGCINTLLQCIDLLYNTANGVDTVRYTQEETRAVINELQLVFGGLRENCAPQTERLLSGAVKKCREITAGIIYAKDIRYLQLFLSEGIYNLQEVFGK